MTWWIVDPEGWLVAESDQPAPGAVAEPPPAHAAEPQPGEHWPRWWRGRWALDLYPQPPAQPVAYAFDANDWFAGEVPVGTSNSTRARPDVFSTTTTPGEPRARLVSGSWVVQAYALPPVHLSRLAFQLRFPLLPDGVTTKYDACALFLTNDGFAAGLIPDAGERQALQMLIQTGMNRMGVSTHVDLALSHAALFTGLLLQPEIPELFRLTPQERAAILSTAINESERP